MLGVGIGLRDPWPPAEPSFALAAKQMAESGDHLFAQTAQTFTYMRQRLERGEVRLPESYAALSSFGHEARLGVTARPQA